MKRFNENKDTPAKKPKPTAPKKTSPGTRSNVSNDHVGQFKSNLDIGTKVVCKVGKSWLEGVVTKINEKVTRDGIFLDDNGVEMKTDFLFGKVIQVTFEDAGTGTQVKEYLGYGNKKTRDERSIKNSVRIPDPVRDHLDEEGGPLGFIYEAVRRLMPDQIKKEWNEKIQLEPSLINNFDFNYMFNHLSKHATTNCFTDIMKFIAENPKAKSIRRIIDVAAGEEGAHKNVLYTIAHVCGLFVAIEMDYLNVQQKNNLDETDEGRITESLDTIEAMASTASEGSFERLTKLNCPIAKVFLFTITGSILKKNIASDPKATLFQSDRRKKISEIDQYPDTGETRCAKLLAALTSLYSAQNDHIGSSGSLGWNKVVNGLLLHLDKSGVSDKTHERLSQLGYIVSIRTIRSKVHQLANDLKSKDIRKDPPPGHVSVKCEVFDNADVHVFGGCVNLIAAGNILLMYEPKDRNERMNKSYIADLPIPCEEHISLIKPTIKDDEAAQNQIDIQNYSSLLRAFYCTTNFSRNSNESTDNEEGESFQQGSSVLFDLCAGHKNIPGRVTSMDAKGKYNIEFKEENGDTSTIDLDISRLRRNNADNQEDVEDLVDYFDNHENDMSFESTENDTSFGSNGLSSQIIESNGQSNSNENEDVLNIIKDRDFTRIEDTIDSFVKGVDDHGGRRKIPPATTIVTDVIKDLSSKNSDASLEVLWRYIHSTEDFYSKTHCMASDQEFMPTLYRSLFLSLHSKEKNKRLPLVLPLAMGHAIKAMACSILTCYRSFFDELFKGIGIKINSPKHLRFLKGKHIRETVRFVVNAIENLRKAYACEYLQKRGKKRCIKCCNGKIRCPLSLLVDAVGNCDDDSHERVFALDDLGRPQCLPRIPDLHALAQDFQRWVLRKRKLGNSSIDIDQVGPSGFVYGDEASIEKLKSESLAFLENNKKKPDFVEDEYGDIWEMSYRDGEEVGLYNRCKMLCILPPMNKSFSALAMRLYLFRKHMNNIGDEEIAIAKANEWNPDADKARIGLPESACLTTVTLCNLLFGSEAFALITSCLLTKMKKETVSKPSASLCQVCKNRTGSCRCLHNFEFVVVLKAGLHSVFMRAQPHYQRLFLMQLIHIAGISKLPDNEAFHGAMERTYASWCVSAKGDSYKVEPVDLRQENSVVQVAKRYGTRDVHAMRSMNSRVTVVSALFAKQAENQWVHYKLPTLAERPDKKRKKLEEWQAQAVLCVWSSILNTVSNGITDTTTKNPPILGTQFVFNDVDLIINRQIDSAFYAEESVKELLIGFNKKLDVSLPVRSRKALQRLHTQKKNTKKGSVGKAPSEISLKKQNAKILASDAVRDASTSPHHVKLMQNCSLFKPLSTAGTNKHDAIFAILNQLESNQPFQYIDGRLGRCGTRPIHLSKVKSDAFEHISQRSIASDDGNQAPIICIVDFLKDIQLKPPGRDNGIHPCTIVELARDILSWAGSLYGKIAASTVILVLDVEEHCSALRKIQRVKRDKVQHIPAHFEKTLSIKNDRDLLSIYGEYGNLMSNEKATFVPYLCDVIMNEMKSKPKPEINWYPRRLFHGNIGFVAGGVRKCVFIGASEDISISSTLSVKRNELEKMIKPVINQGEGERMMFSIMHQVMKCSFSHDRKCDTVFCLHSDDSDVIAGMAMPFVQVLENSCIRENTFLGSILVQGPNKSASSLTKLCKRVREDLDIASGEPTGKGFIFFIDLISLYYHFKTMSKFMHIPPEARPLLIPACFAFMNNDYMPPCFELNYSDFFKAISSKLFIKAVDKFSEQSCAPILRCEMDLDGMDLDGNMSNSVISFQLSGIQLTFTILMMLRPRTKNQMLKSMTEDDYENFICKNGIDTYDLIRAIAIMGAELYPVPDPLSFVARVTCANFIVRQWGFCIFEDAVTPPINDAELEGTFWNIPPDNDSSKDPICDVHYSLVHVWQKDVHLILKKENDPNPSAWKSDTWNALIGLGMDYPLSPKYLESKMITIDIPSIILSSLKNRGHFPITRIDGKALMPCLGASSSNEVVSKVNEYLNGFSSSKDRAKKLSDFFMITITSLTAFNAVGGGRPLLNTANASVVSTGGYKGDDAYNKKVDWPDGCDDWVTKPLKDIFKIFGDDANYTLAASFLSSLTIHLFEESRRLTGNIVIGEDEGQGQDSESDSEILDFDDDDDESVNLLDLLDEDGDGMSIDEDMVPL